MFSKGSTRAEDNWVVVEDKEEMQTSDKEEHATLVHAEDQLDRAQTTGPPEAIVNIGSGDGRPMGKSHYDLENRANQHIRTTKFVRQFLWFMMLLSFACLIMLIAVAANKHDTTKADRIHLLAIVMPLFLIANGILFAVRNETHTLIVLFVVVGMLIGYIVAVVGVVLSGKND